MTPLDEPLPLRLSRDDLVLQPMHGHLDLEPMLLQPGLRCSIGSAEPCELVSVGRVAVRAFDFHLKTVSSDAQSVKQKLDDEMKADQVLPLKPNFDDSGSDASTPERLAQRISKLLGNLQCQVLLLREKETELQEQLRRHRLDTASQPASTPSRGSLTERVIRERERILAAEQAQCEKLRQKATERLQELETAVEEFEQDRASLQDDQAAVRKLAEEVIQKQQQLADWEERLRGEQLTLNREREAVPDHSDEQTAPSPRIELRDAANVGSVPSAQSAGGRIDGESSLPTPARAPSVLGFSRMVAEPESDTSQNRPLQTMLTVMVFGLSAFFIGADLGSPKISTVIGWGTAALGIISTVDLLGRRWFRSGR